MRQALWLEIVWWLDVGGVAVFAATGALVASRKQMDIVGFVLVASVTGIGGGTVRDLLLGRLPVFWIGEEHYVLICAAVAVTVFFTAHLIESRFRVLLWADALGLALYGVLGTEIARASGASPLVAILMGMLTATFGGLIRDVLCGEVPLILRKELYATAALAGAASDVLLQELGIAAIPTMTSAFVVAFVIRALAIGYGLSLPVYRPRPGRDYR